MNIDWNKLPNDEIINQTVEALKKNGINAQVAENGEEAKKKALELIPDGAEVFTMTSVTLDQIGLSKEIDDTGNYNSVRNELYKLSRETDSSKMQKMGAAPEYAIGSVHAVTKDGKVVIVSRTGSQLSPYVYGAGHVVWVVSAKKIVDNLDQAFDRIYDHILPLESERVAQAYGMMNGSEVAKKLIINREVNEERINLIFVKEDLGF